MTAAPALTIPHQRTRGTAEVGLRGGRLARLYQQGSAKAIVLHPGPEVVFLNTAGGLTGGDHLRYALHCDTGVTATTQTAERAYRSTSGAARLDVALSVEAGHLDWLPQETILFDRASLRRDTRISLGAEASCLVLEAIVLGRAAMGETVRDFALSDRREITRAGRPVLVEPLRLTPEALHHPAALAGTRAVASLALIARGAEDALAPVRAALAEAGVQGAASGFDGRLTVRLMAPDGWPLRRQIARLLAVLRKPSMTAPLPRVWQI